MDITIGRAQSTAMCLAIASGSHLVAVFPLFGLIPIVWIARMRKFKFHDLFTSATGMARLSRSGSILHCSFLIPSLVVLTA